MRAILLLLLILSCDLTIIHAQSKEAAPGESTTGLLAFQVGIPSGAMQAAIRNNMGNLGFGAAAAVLSDPFSWGRGKGRSPLRVGAELGYTYYGRFLSDVNISGYNGNYKTSYGILQLNALLQVRPRYPAPVSPFVEVLAGGNFYLSHTKENLNVIESSLGIQGFELDSYASVGFNKGLAVGCKFGRPERDNGRFILRVSYNRGKDIRYVVRNSIQYDPYSGRLSYEIGRAPVVYWMVQVGVGI